MRNKLFDRIKKPERKFYMPGFDEINQLEETPASKQRTEEWRFNVNTLISAISAVAAVIAAIAAVATLIIA